MISAIERLRALRAGRLITPVLDRCQQETRPEDLPEPWRELYEERAAIREYDGGQAREHAEAEALREVVERMRAVDELGAHPDDRGEAGL